MSGRAADPAMAAPKGKLGELVWEHRVQAAVAVAFVAAAAISISAVGPSLSAVVSFFWPLLLSTAFFLVAVSVLLWISPPPADDADESGKELIDFVAGCRPNHLACCGDRARGRRGGPAEARDLTDCNAGGGGGEEADSSRAVMSVQGGHAQTRRRAGLAAAAATSGPSSG